MDIIRYYPVFGLLSPITFAVLWTVAAVLEPSWVLGTNTLSELGICGNASSEVCFNMGCVLSGMFGILFAIGLLGKKGAFFLCGAFMMVSCFALSGIGVMDLHYLLAHETTTTLFGTAATLSMIVSAVGDFKDRRWVFLAITLLMLITCTAADLDLSFQSFEPIGVSSVLVWTSTQAIKILIYEGIGKESRTAC